MLRIERTWLTRSCFVLEKESVGDYTVVFCATFFHNGNITGYQHRKNKLSKFNNK